MLMANGCFPSSYLQEMFVMRDISGVHKMTYMFLIVVNQIVGKKGPFSVTSYDLMNALFEVMETELADRATSIAGVSAGLSTVDISPSQDDEKASQMPSMDLPSSEQKVKLLTTGQVKTEDIDVDSLSPEKLEDIYQLTLKVVKMLKVMQTSKSKYFFGFGRCKVTDEEYARFLRGLQKIIGRVE